MIFKKRFNNNIAASAIAMLLLFSVGCSNENTNNNTSKQNTPETKTQNNTTNSKEEAKPESSKEEKSNAFANLNLKEVKVSRVVDGDTIELLDGRKVRLIGVNTPESTTRTEPYGKEASDYTKSQLTGKTAYLEKDVSETDKYGRLLRYVWLSIPNEIRSKMFNAILSAEWLCGSIHLSTGCQISRVFY